MSHAISPSLAQSTNFLQFLFQVLERHETKEAEQVCVQVLKKSETLTLSRPKGSHIECLGGCVWITQDGYLRDNLLEAGQALFIDQPARILVHALESSQVRIQPAVY